MKAVSKLLLATVVFGTAYGDAGVRLGQDFAAELRLLDENEETGITNQNEAGNDHSAGADAATTSGGDDANTDGGENEDTVTEDEVLQLEEEYLHEYTTYCGSLDMF